MMKTIGYPILATQSWKRTLTSRGIYLVLPLKVFFHSLLLSTFKKKCSCTGERIALNADDMKAQKC